MVAGNACNTYLNSHYEGMDPKQLILMLYDGALKFIRFAKEGIEEKNIQKRGENLSKVIAIITELNSSLDPGVKDESIDFLRSLYATMLVELPKVSMTNDIKTLDLTASYISRLRDIWAKDVMGKKPAAQPETPRPAATQSRAPRPVAPQETKRSQVENRPPAAAKKTVRPGYGQQNGYGNMGVSLGRKSISA